MVQRLFILVLAVFTLISCQHRLSPSEVKAKLEEREHKWHAELFAGYDLDALRSFIVETIDAHPLVDGIRLSTRAVEPRWTIGGDSMRSGDWFFNAWDIRSDTFTLHANFGPEKKVVWLKCVRISRSEFRVVEFSSEDIPDELAI